MIALSDGTRIYWAPDDDVQGAIVAALTSAQSQIRVSMYALTNVAIVDALIAAHVRGVDLKLVLDASQAATASQAAHMMAVEEAALGGSPEAEQIARLRVAGVPLVIGNSSKGGILHQKVACIDAHVVLSGSTNWSLSAVTVQRNELRIEDSTAAAAGYLAVWQAYWDHVTVATDPNAV